MSATIRAISARRAGDGLPSTYRQSSSGTPGHNVGRIIVIAKHCYDVIRILAVGVRDAIIAVGRAKGATEAGGTTRGSRKERSSRPGTAIVSNSSVANFTR
jgi:hypothetical protein